MTYRPLFLAFALFLAGCADDLVAPPTPMALEPVALEPAYSFSLSPNLPFAATTLPELDTHFANIDLCAALTGLCGATICPGEELTGPDGAHSGAGWKIAGCGNLNELRIVSGHARLDGPLQVGLGVESGTIVDIGCRVVTVTLPAIPAIPATPPIRNPFTGAIIIPGTPGWPGRPATTVSRRVPADCSPIRQPSVPRPGSVLSLQAVAQPHVVLELEMEAAGTGEVELRFPIPYAAIGLPRKVSILPLSGETDGSDLYRIGANVGIYVVLRGRLSETTTRFRIAVDLESQMSYAYTPAGGWTGAFEPGAASYTGSVHVASPDTAQFRYGVQPAIAFSVEPWPAPELGLFSIRPRFQAEVGAWLLSYQQNTFSLNALGTLKNDAENGLEGMLYAGFATYATDEEPPCAPDRETFQLADCIVQTVGSLDEEWVLPFSCCEADLYDQYNTGLFRFIDGTTGAAIDHDPDGYQLTWQRASMVPAPYVDSVMTLRLGVGDTAHYPDQAAALTEFLPYHPFRAISPTMCTEFYSDLPFGLIGGIMSDFRRAGFGVPLYTKIIGCQATPADYTLEVSDLAVNCTALAANPRVVALRPAANLAHLDGGSISDPTEVPVAVHCRPLVGELRVNATTTGRDPDGNGYRIVVDDGSRGSVGASDSRTFPGLRVGVHEFTVDDLAFNCTLESANPGQATIAFEDVVDAEVRVGCASVYVALCDMVSAGVERGQVPAGVGGGICQRLRAADSAREGGNASAVRGIFTGLQHQLASLSGGSIDEGTANALLAVVGYIAEQQYFID